MAPHSTSSTWATSGGGSGGAHVVSEAGRQRARGHFAHLRSKLVDQERAKNLLKLPGEEASGFGLDAHVEVRRADAQRIAGHVDSHPCSYRGLAVGCARDGLTLVKLMQVDRRALFIDGVAVVLPFPSVVCERQPV